MDTPGHLTMQTPKPHVVIVPASFAPPSLYRHLVRHLSEYGLSATVVDLPSVGYRHPLPAASMLEDAEHIRAITTKLSDDGHEIILVMHSYGGICGTESTAGVSEAERQSIGKLGGITQLVYISSPVPEIGGSVRTMMGDKMPHFMQLEVSRGTKRPRRFANTQQSSQGDYLTSEPQGCASINFSDLPLAEAIQYAKQMTAHSAKSFDGPLQNAGYLNIPVAYIICEHDISVPPEFQRSVIDMISAKSNREVTTILCNSGHFPNISAPAEVASFIERIATSSS